MSMSNNWYKSASPEYRKPTWRQNDWYNGGSVERHEDSMGRNVYVRRNTFGDVSHRSKPKWGSDWKSGKWW